jgi:hypothetical protein
VSRLIIGNLDAENEWAGAPPGAAPSIEAASGAATLLRVLGSPGDMLWTPTTVDPARVPNMRGMEQLRLVSGPFPEATGRLAWAETGTLPPWTASTPGSSWIDRLWSIAPAPPEVARAVNDRAFDLDVATELGMRVPGACMTSTSTETRDAIRAIDGPWVAKSTWSAAGRHRIRGEASSLDDPAVEHTLSNLLKRGPLRVESWLPRTVDVGMVGLVSPGGSFEQVGTHELIVDGHGRFRGLRARPHGATDDMRRAFAGAGRALHEAGYRGPFGIDGFRTQDGRWFPIAEINARLTFGFVFHALGRSVARTIRNRMQLTFAKTTPSADAVPLFLPGGRSPIGAWVHTL